MNNLFGNYGKSLIPQQSCVTSQNLLNHGIWRLKEISKISPALLGLASFKATRFKRKKCLISYLMSLKQLLKSSKEIISFD